MCEGGTWLPGCLVAWLLGYLVAWGLGIGYWVLGIGYLVTWLLGYLGVWGPFAWDARGDTEGMEGDRARHALPLHKKSAKIGVNRWTYLRPSAFSIRHARSALTDQATK